MHEYKTLQDLQLIRTTGRASELSGSFDQFDCRMNILFTSWWNSVCAKKKKDKCSQLDSQLRKKKKQNPDNKYGHAAHACSCLLLEGRVVCRIHDRKPVLTERSTVGPSKLTHELKTKTQQEVLAKPDQVVLNTHICVMDILGSSTDTWMQFLMFSLVGFSSTILEAYFKARPYILFTRACL